MSLSVIAASVATVCAVVAAVSVVPAGATGATTRADSAISAGEATGSSFDKPASWASRTVDAPKSATGYDPINVVIVPADKEMDDAQYNSAILAALRREKGVFWNEVGISTNPAQALDGKCISAQSAKVQPGSEKSADQNFSWRTVKCTSGALLDKSDVTNHVRVYVQHATGAMFLAVSEEHFCYIDNGTISFFPWHCITKTGYNAGRAALVAELKKLPGFDVSIRDVQEYKAGVVPQAPDGYHTPYDGKVAVVTVMPKENLLSYEADGWQYENVDVGGDPGFQDPDYDVSEWPFGQAGFGTTDGTCPWNNADDVHVEWPANTDMLVRHYLKVPTGTASLHITGSVDNDATVYINGKKVWYTQSGYCAAGAIDVTVPAKDLTARTLLAIRGHDYGQATYLDVTVSADIG